MALPRDCSGFRQEGKLNNAIVITDHSSLCILDNCNQIHPPSQRRVAPRSASPIGRSLNRSAGVVSSAGHPLRADHPVCAIGYPPGFAQKVRCRAPHCSGGLMTADNTAICEIAGGHRPPLQWPFSTFCAKPLLTWEGSHAAMSRFRKTSLKRSDGVRNPSSTPFRTMGPLLDF